ncbi:restriction endonuclease [Campylobacter hyointestinalis]|uniref:Restriction endonuclease n=1 Tax=Campylobacter hyointestinalis subsp. lawsonii TaxID=91353 RepID=A0AAV6EIJ7_CAMHY|nr:restriction endonuclease [Campylobacter hyointestinalis]KAB0614447.1 restriction endonuclease [Campylobacter hyointestinalis subsp. lawsonii]QKF70200.1 type II restriction/modification system, restriction endonuclease [Campylobacter hyointestinalis subsp. lawsonii]RAZ28709.1 restriction endonuclease [Campylobacter hyointestinalis subsp. lawsonii]
MTREEVLEFLNSRNYDVRISGNARWIDQKCTTDVILIIADCILQHTGYNTETEFTVSDIWQDQYTKDNVEEIFLKPNLDSNMANNEYDKYFSQPINLLEYSGALLDIGTNSRHNYKINNLKLLEFIALRETNSLFFLTNYIRKVLQDSGIYDSFQNFFDNQTCNNFRQLKETFIDFTINHTRINKSLECRRIFTKILNPLAFSLQKLGTRRGFLSSTPITLDELRYNRINWRDDLSGKSKNITRQEYNEQQQQIDAATSRYNVERAKRIVRRFNAQYHNSVSEVLQDTELVNATQIHHIFPESEFPSISDYIENLIALTPNQHISMAHPNNQTRYIDRDFQYICLLAKTKTIMNDLLGESRTETYNFDRYKTVLNTGLGTDDFDAIEYLNFASLLEKIDLFYSDFNTESYGYLLERNRPLL